MYYSYANFLVTYANFLVTPTFGPRPPPPSSVQLYEKKLGDERHIGPGNPLRSLLALPIPFPCAAHKLISITEHKEDFQNRAQEWFDRRGLAVKISGRRGIKQGTKLPRTRQTIKALLLSCASVSHRPSSTAVGGSKKKKNEASTVSGSASTKRK